MGRKGPTPFLGLACLLALPETSRHCHHFANSFRHLLWPVHPFSTPNNRLHASVVTIELPTLALLDDHLPLNALPQAGLSGKCSASLKSDFDQKS